MTDESETVAEKGGLKGSDANVTAVGVLQIEDIFPKTLLTHCHHMLLGLLQQNVVFNHPR